MLSAGVQYARNSAEIESLDKPGSWGIKAEGPFLHGDVFWTHTVAYGLPHSAGDPNVATGW